MDIHVDLPSFIYFSLTVFFGILYGNKCYRDGLSKGADDIIDYLEVERIIDVDPDTGEITRAR